MRAGFSVKFSFHCLGLLSFPRHTNPIVENGQTHPCQKVIQEVSTNGYFFSFPFKALKNWVEETLSFMFMGRFILLA